MTVAGALLLCGAALSAWFFPITRERHARMRRLLAELGLGGYTNTSYPRGLKALLDG